MDGARSSEVEANGIRFGLLEWGKDSAPLALLLHGYPDTAWTWRHLGPQLAASGWHAVAPFSRGYAPSGLAPDGRYLVRDLVEDTLHLEQTLRGDGQSALVGHDWGAVTVWAVASKNPESFRSLVAMAVPPPRAILDPLRSLHTLPTALRQMRMSWYFLFNQFPGAERTLTRLIPRLWRKWSPGYDPREDLGLVFESLDGPERLRAALGYYRDNLRSEIGFLSSLQPTAPVLYLHGRNDGCVTIDLAEAAGQRLPAGSRFVGLDEAGHFIQLERPTAVNDLIGEWIGRPK